MYTHTLNFCLITLIQVFHDIKKQLLIYIRSRKLINKEFACFNYYMFQNICNYFKHEDETYLFNNIVIDFFIFQTQLHFDSIYNDKYNILKF